MGSSIVVATVFALICTVLNIGLANECGNLTLEGCGSNADCLGGVAFPSFTAFCGGRLKSTDDLLVCSPGQPNDVKECLCYPTAFRYCATDQDCFDQTYCGISPLTNNSICVGCKVMQSETVNFKPVNGRSANLRCAKQGVPCGRGFDFCSVTMECAGDYKCVSIGTDSSPFVCSPDDSSCSCFLLDEDKKSKTSKIALAPCDSDNKCDDEREGCIWDSVSNINFCISCDAPKVQAFLVLNDSSQCENVPPRPQPIGYPLSPNGLTLDLCEDDIQCLGSRKCVEWKLDTTDPNFNASDIVPCQNQDDRFCFCRSETYKSCKFSANCQRGESCASTERLNVTTSCVSNRFLNVLSNNLFDVHVGIRKNGDGDGLTSDACKFDWDCKSPRRCTAIRDAFGGCAGRDSCICQNLGNVVCTKNSDCTTGEVCVNYIDGKRSPICLSRKSLFKYPHLRRVSDLDDAAPTPIPRNLKGGLTSDPCLTNDDCKDQRVCAHIAEPRNSCNGRRQCQCWVPIDGNNSCTFTEDDCEDGEVCFDVKDAVPQARECTSEKALNLNPLRSLFEIFYRDQPSLSPTKNIASNTPSISPSPSTSAPSASPVSVPDSETPEPDDKSPEPTPSVDPTGPIVSNDVSPEPTLLVNPTPSAEIVGGEEVGVQENGTSQSIEATSEPICIDAKLLSGMDATRLVFAEHRRASVLCDSDGSCATPGHMVTYQKVAMSMKTYCLRADVTCVKRVTLVNSPRMQMGLRVQTKTNGLQMTALAARYESWIEEMALKQIIHKLPF